MSATLGPSNTLRPVEEVLEAQAIEEADAGEAEGSPGEVRRLPERAAPGEVDAWRGEVRTAAMVAAGGVVAGAATVAAVRAVRAVTAPSKGRGLLRRKQPERPLNVVASRSFLVDVHLLGR